MIITYIYSNRLEDQVRVQFRCRNLAEAINRVGPHRANLLELNAFIQNIPEAQKMCAESDLLVVFRYLYGPVLNTIEYWKARDKRVIVDFDQALNFLTADLPEYTFWHAGLPLAANGAGSQASTALGDPPPLEQFQWGLGMVDAATTVSARLADDWSQHTTVYTLPDYLNTYQYPVLGQSHGNELWLGLGHTTQLADLKNSGLAAALQAVCQARPQLRLVWCDSKKFPDDELELDPAQIILRDPKFFDEWVSVLLQLDLGLAPVASDFSLRSGPVDLLEFMIAKIPWLATEQSAFRHLEKYGRWVLNSAEAWEKALLETVDQLALHQKKAARVPFLFALGQDVSVNIDKALKIYAAVLNQQPGSGAG